MRAAAYGCAPAAIRAPKARNNSRRQAWKGLIYVRVRPTWLRFSDYGADPPCIIELETTALESLK